MRTQLVWATLLGGLAACGLLAPSASAGGKPDRGKVRGVIIDGANNHSWWLTTPFMKKVLEDCGRFTVDVSTTNMPNPKVPKDWKSVPFPPDLKNYDVVLLNYNGPRWPESFQKELEWRLDRGEVSLVIVHAANNSFEKIWPEYDRMIGMGWRNNKYGDRLTLDKAGKEVRVLKGDGPGAGHGDRHEFLVVIRDRSHPITRGLPPEWMHTKDELYQGMRGPIQNVHLLATAYADPAKGGKRSSGEHEPMLWTVSYGKGRVFHTTLGHDLEAMRCIGFITTLQRGTEWAATGNVTLSIPDNFPSASKSSSVPAK